MRVLLVQAHPVDGSYNAALRDEIITALRPRHDVDLMDLYAETFDPVMSRAERLGYHESPSNIAPVADYVARLRAADALVLCFPAWTFGPPAMIKGWIDRVMLPGVALHIQDSGKVLGGLANLQKVAGVVTFGQTRWRATLMGNYPRKLVTRYLRFYMGMHKPALFLAHYKMNVSTPETRARFLRQVHRTFRRF